MRTRRRRRIRGSRGGAGGVGEGVHMKKWSKEGVRVKT